MRRGNLNGHVRAFRYVTVGTFDSYLYQTVQNKQAFIGQVFTSDNPARSAADLDETVLSYAEIKALATGDPNIQRRMELENRAGQLKLLKSAHSKHMDSLRMNRETILIPRRDSLHERYGAMCADAPRAQAAPEPMLGDRWCGMSIEGVHIADREQACRMIVEAAKNATLKEPVRIGEYRGFEV